MTDEPPKKPKKRMTQAQLDNLKKGKKDWVKGQSGNPKGKAPGTLNRSTILKRYLEATFKTDDGKTRAQPFGIDGRPITVAEALEMALIKKGLSGNVEALKMIKDDMYGKLADKTELTGADGSALLVQIVDDLK